MFRQTPRVTFWEQRLVRSCCLILGGCICSSAFCATALALPSQLTISQLYHTHWTAFEGAPTGIEALAQTRDGFLWMATSGGLFRFDGIMFEHIMEAANAPLLSENLYTLFARPDGGLWIGYRFGGASFLKDGRIKHYGEAEGLPPGTVTTFAQDASGVMWAGTTHGLAKLVFGVWQFVGEDWNVPREYIEQAKTDRNGVLWILTGDNTVRYLRPGTRRFERIDIGNRKIQVAELTSGPDGSMYLFALDDTGITTLRTLGKSSAVAARWDKYVRPQASHAVSLFDRDGNFWTADALGARRYQLPNSTGDDDVVVLSGKHPFEMLEDREGNVWIATSDGLDRFRAPALVKASLHPDSRYFPLAPAPDGGMWVGTSTGYIYLFSPSGQTLIAAGQPVPVPETFYSDTSGELWVGGMDAIWRLHQGQWHRSPRPPISIGFPGSIQSMTKDASGAMWVSVVRIGVYRVVDDEWTPKGGRSDLASEPATTLFTDAAGRVWFGYVHGEIAALDGDRLIKWPASQTAVQGPILALAEQGEHIWVGGDRGLACFKDRVFHPVMVAGRGPFQLVSGIVATGEGDLWLNTSEGVVHIVADEVRQLLSHPTHPVKYQLLNHLDGLPGRPLANRPLPTAAASGDGRIWFATSSGVVWANPRAAHSNPIVPTVVIKSIVADGHRHAPEDATPLPAETRNLQISYTAPSFTIPERVRFRYRLEGNNAQWLDVGSRRDAYFTDLPPGQYRFHVVASNSDGVWNENGATIDFVIPPTFVQSVWFLALCVITALTSVWILFLLRLRQERARLRWRLEERIVERERIARELHDTFLQAVQGLILRFQSAMERIPPGEPARAMMEEALDRADHVLADGRDAVANLRASTQSSIDLASSLKMLGDRMAADYGMYFAASVEGEPRELHPVVREEAYRIGAEALANAFQHSHGTLVKLQITYSRKGFLMRVCDDGHGFHPDRSPSGHWGLTGMRERAGRIRGRLNITSRMGSGSTVELEVRARIAFEVE